MLETPIFCIFKPVLSSELHIFAPSYLFETSWIYLLVCHPESLQLETQKLSFIPSSFTICVHHQTHLSVLSHMLQSFPHLSFSAAAMSSYVSIVSNFKSLLSSFCFHPCLIHSPPAHQNGILNNRLIMYLFCNSYIDSYCT